MTLDLTALRAVAEAARGKHWTDGAVTAYEVELDPDTALALLARAEEANTLEAERDALREQVARMTEALEFQLKSHRAFPMSGSHRFQDMMRGLKPDELRECDCDQCYTSRAALKDTP